MSESLLESSMGASRATRVAVLALSALLTLTLSVATGATAQEDEPPLKTHVYTMQHQRAADAVGLLYPMLTSRGRVELRPGGNTVVVRDTPEAVLEVLAILRTFDHPSKRMRVKLQLVRAQDGAAPTPGSGLAEDLTRKLQGLLRYESFWLLAEQGVDLDEGDQVRYELGDGYSVDFRLGTIEPQGNLKLHSFRVGRADDDQGFLPLIRTHVNLKLDQPAVLGMARSESSERALMIVVTCSLAPEEGT